MRRGLALVVAALWMTLGLSGTSPAAGAETPGFDYQKVVDEAKRLAGERYREPSDSAVPAALRQLGYDGYQAIRARAETTLWADLQGVMFRMQFFPVGFLYTRPVAIHVVTDGVAEEVAPRPELFDWSDAGIPQPPERIAFAGLRLLFPLHRPDHHDEVAAFLGASYFRILGREQAYGLSARGLALDTGLQRREEFPHFRAFWLVRPAPGAREITFFALLDSPSLTGAYRFVLRPGTETSLEVTATLHLRADVAALGLAPLTSMFIAGENMDRRALDFRPEVHDSDGLLIETGAGERIWRPLTNPRELRVSAFADTNPRGFGLLQRDRDFGSYQDLQAQYHRRPSYWAEPIGEWGEGEVRLLEIPSDAEIHDNIAAFWVPRTPTRRGETIERSWRLHAFAGPTRAPRGGRVLATRIGSVNLPGTGEQPRAARRFVVDFDGGDLDVLRPEQPVAPEVTVTAGKVLRTHVEPLPDRRAWRLTLDVEPEGRNPVEMRAFLRLYDEALTETWAYAWRP
jgi:glucans biosynthesis protein